MAAGRVMAWSISRFPDLFSPFFVHMVRQGESEGVLGEVLTTMADYLEREEGPVPGHLAGPAGSGFEDRKSTRLNSSHMSISYAVFCLKKKKLKKSYTHS